MDGFDKKRQMVKVLQDMLKHNASEEVSHGMPKAKPPLPSVPVSAPAGLEKMKDGGMVDLTKEQHLMVPTSEDRCMAHGGTMPEHSEDCHYAEGGLADTDMAASDEPNRLLEPKAESDGDNGALGLLPEVPQDEQGQEASRQTLANDNMEHEDEDNNSSSFEGFFSRKKRK